MPAYVIGEVEIVPPEKLQGYGPAVAVSIEKFGGRYLARGSKPEVLEGGPAHNVLIIEFPSADVARAWYASPEYQAAKAIRAGATNLRLMIVDSFVKPAV